MAFSAARYTYLPLSFAGGDKIDYCDTASVREGSVVYFKPLDLTLGVDESFRVKRSRRFTFPGQMFEKIRNFRSLFQTVRTYYT